LIYHIFYIVFEKVICNNYIEFDTNTLSIISNNQSWIILAFKCKKCNLEFEEKKRLEIHKKVHGRKSKVSEYGSPEFNQDRLRG
jgi:hypothetical protein